MVSWQVHGRHVLVVGGGNVGLSRVRHLLDADAKVTVVSEQLVPELQRFKDMDMLEAVYKRKFRIQDLQLYETLSREEVLSIDTTTKQGSSAVDEFEKTKFALVLVCLNDHELGQQIYYRSRQLGLPVNLADRPDECDFYFGSVYRKGSLQIMISTNGRAPRFCNRLKNFKIKPMFDNLDVTRAVSTLGYMRDQLRATVCPGEDPATIEKRMDWNRQVTDFFSIEEWCEMTPSDADQLLGYFPEVPTLK